MSVLGMMPGFGFLQPVSQYYQNKQYNDSQRQIAKDAQDFELKMWNMQNEYNSPSSQMQRWNQAGLNPNLIYSQGTPGNASSMPSAHKANIMNQFAGLNMNESLNVLSMYQDYRLKESQIANTEARTLTEAYKPLLTEAQTEQTRSRITLNSAQTRKTLLDSNYVDAQTKQAILNYQDSLSKYGEGDERTAYLRSIAETELEDRLISLELKGQDVISKKLDRENTRNMMSLRDQQRIALEYENKMNETLKKYAVTSRDPYWQRVLAKAFDWKDDSKNANKWRQRRKGIRGGYGEW
ncbi:MAG: hypothetical protein QXX12_05200 [Nanopusillaceae archaeon]